MMANANKDSIYTASVTLNVGDNIQFKCRINGLWTGLEEFPGGGANRSYTVVLNGILNFWYSDVIPSNVLSVAIQASSRAIISGQTVQFNDVSSGSPVSWKWSFPGGNPAMSQLKNPLIAYASDGIYPVTLTVKNT